MKTRMKLRAQYVTLPLSAVAMDAQSNAPDAPDLHPYDYEHFTAPVIVVRESHGWEIVDGFHRLSGLAGWAEGERVDPSSVLIRAIDITGTDEELIGLAAAPGARQAKVIEAIAKIARG